MKRTLLIVSNDYNQHSIICWDSRLKVDKQMQLHRFGGVYPVAAIAVETDIKLNGAIQTLSSIYNGKLPLIYLIDEYQYVEEVIGFSADEILMTKDLGRLSDVSIEVEIQGANRELKILDYFYTQGRAYSNQGGTFKW